MCRSLLFLLHIRKQRTLTRKTPGCVTCLLLSLCYLRVCSEACGSSASDPGPTIRFRHRMPSVACLLDSHLSPLCRGLKLFKVLFTILLQKTNGLWISGIDSEPDSLGACRWGLRIVSLVMLVTSCIGYNHSIECDAWDISRSAVEVGEDHRVATIWRNSSFSLTNEWPMSAYF